MNRYVYDEKLELEQEVNKLDKKIEDLKYANIVSSKMQESINEDIKNINIKIRDININNIECALIRKVKVLGKYVLRAIPYVIIANLFLGFHLFIFREFPFYRDLEKRFPLHEVTLDKDVTIDKVEETRKPRYNNEVYYTDGKAFYTTKWELGEDNKYHRLIKEYDVSIITPEELKILVNKPKVELEDILYRYRSEKEEIKNKEELTLEELNKEDTVRFIYHYIDENDFVMELQDPQNNLGFTLAYLILTIASSGVLFFSRRDKHYNETFIKELEKIKKRYSKTDIEEIKKLFKENKIKFELVKRGEVTLTDPITNEKTRVR